MRISDWSSDVCSSDLALLLAAQMTTDEYPPLITAVVVIACASAVLGLLQILSGPSSPAYLYRIANNDSMVGLFSNRNHHAIFLACTIPRSEEHTSVLQSLMRISYAVFCLQKKNHQNK